jgi:hypothetical protein
MRDLTKVISILHYRGLETESNPGLWEASTLAKSYSNSVIIAIRNIYI